MQGVILQGSRGGWELASGQFMRHYDCYYRTVSRPAVTHLMKPVFQTHQLDFLRGKASFYSRRKIIGYSWYRRHWTLILNIFFSFILLEKSLSEIQICSFIPLLSWREKYICQKFRRRLLKKNIASDIFVWAKTSCLIWCSITTDMNRSTRTMD